MKKTILILALIFGLLLFKMWYAVGKSLKRPFSVPTTYRLIRVIRKTRKFRVCELPSHGVRPSSSLREHRRVFASRRRAFFKKA